jgi:fumarate hydratase, class I
MRLSDWLAPLKWPLVDKYTNMMLKMAQFLDMIGKSERSDANIASLKQHGAIYQMSIDETANLVSKAIKKSRTVAVADLEMEAIYEFEVEDMPVTVVVNCSTNATQMTGPVFW